MERAIRDAAPGSRGSVHLGLGGPKSKLDIKARFLLPFLLHHNNPHPEDSNRPRSLVVGAGVPDSRVMPGYHSYRRTVSHTTPPPCDAAGHTVTHESESLGARLRRGALTGNSGVFRRMKSFGGRGHKESRHSVAAGAAATAAAAHGQGHAAVALTASYPPVPTSSSSALRFSPSSESLASEGSSARWGEVSFTNPLRRARSDIKVRNPDMSTTTFDGSRGSCVARTGVAGKSGLITTMPEEDPVALSVLSSAGSSIATDTSPLSTGASTGVVASGVPSAVSTGMIIPKQSVRRTESLPGSQLETRWRTSLTARVTPVSELPRVRKRYSTPREVSSLPVEIENDSPPPPPVPLRPPRDDSDRVERSSDSAEKVAVVETDATLEPKYQEAKTAHGGSKRTRQEEAFQTPETYRSPRAGKDSAGGAGDGDSGDLETLRRKAHALNRLNRKLSKKVARRDKAISDLKAKIILYKERLAVHDTALPEDAIGDRRARMKGWDRSSSVLSRSRGTGTNESDFDVTDSGRSVSPTPTRRSQSSKSNRSVESTQGTKPSATQQHTAGSATASSPTMQNGNRPPTKSPVDAMKPGDDTSAADGGRSGSGTGAGGADKAGGRIVDSMTGTGAGARPSARSGGRRSEQISRGTTSNGPASSVPPSAPPLLGRIRLAGGPHSTEAARGVTGGEPLGIRGRTSGSTVPGNIPGDSGPVATTPVAVPAAPVPSPSSAPATTPVRVRRSRSRSRLRSMPGRSRHAVVGDGDEEEIREGKAKSASALPSANSGPRAGAGVSAGSAAPRSVFVSEGEGESISRSRRVYAAGDVGHMNARSLSLHTGSRDGLHPGLSSLTPSSRSHHGGDPDSISPLALGGHASKTAPSTPASRSTPGTIVGAWADSLHDTDATCTSARVCGLDKMSRTARASMSAAAGMGGSAGACADSSAVLGDGSSHGPLPSMTSPSGRVNHKALFGPNTIIEFAEDSPAFRRKVETLDRNVEGLRDHLQQLVEVARKYCSSGFAFCDQGRELANMLVNLEGESWSPKLGDLAPALGSLGKVVGEIQRFQEELLQSLKTTFFKPIEEFVRREVKTIRKMKQEMHRACEDHEHAMGRYLQLRRNSEESVTMARAEEVAVTKRRFELSRFDLVRHLNLLETEKKFQLVHRTCSALYAYYDLFQKCFVLVATEEPSVKELQRALHISRKEQAQDDRMWALKRQNLELALTENVARSLDHSPPRTSSTLALSAPGISSTWVSSSSGTALSNGVATASAARFSPVPLSRPSVAPSGSGSTPVPSIFASAPSPGFQPQLQTYQQHQQQQSQGQASQSQQNTPPVRSAPRRMHSLAKFLGTGAGNAERILGSGGVGETSSSVTGSSSQANTPPSATNGPSPASGSKSTGAGMTVTMSASRGKGVPASGSKSGAWGIGAGDGDEHEHGDAQEGMGDEVAALSGARSSSGTFFASPVPYHPASINKVRNAWEAQEGFSSGEEEEIEEEDMDAAGAEAAAEGSGLHRKRVVSDATTATAFGGTLSPRIGVGDSGRDDVAMKKSGYLWKRSTNVRKDWKRRYFFIQGGFLFYQRQETSESPPVQVCEIKLCGVQSCLKENDLRFSFEIICPTRRTYVQAEDEESHQSWVRSIKAEIEHQLSSSQSGNQEDRSTILQEPSPVVDTDGHLVDFSLSQAQLVRMSQANPECVDCGVRNPEWASINLAVMMCIECSGIHRAMGVHVSKVRSLTLDRWTNPLLDLLEAAGNVKANRVWEANVGKGSLIGPDSSRSLREAFIRSKYELRAFLDPPVDISLDAVLSASQKLFAACKAGDVGEALWCIAHGADVNWRNPDEAGCTAVHEAVRGSHIALVELLAHNGCNLDAVSDNEETPLKIAMSKQEAEPELLALLLSKLDGRHEHHAGAGSAASSHAQSQHQPARHEDWRKHSPSNSPPPCFATSALQHDSERSLARSQVNGLSHASAAAAASAAGALASTLGSNY